MRLSLRRYKRRFAECTLNRQRAAIKKTVTMYAKRENGQRIKRKKQTTLDNASITKTGSYGYAIGRNPGDLNIALIGSNTIISVKEVSKPFIGVYSSGKVNIKAR